MNYGEVFSFAGRSCRLWNIICWAKSKRVRGFLYGFAYNIVKCDGIGVTHFLANRRYRTRRRQNFQGNYVMRAVSHTDMYVISQKTILRVAKNPGCIFSYRLYGREAGCPPLPCSVHTWWRCSCRNMTIFLTVICGMLLLPDHPVRTLDLLWSGMPIETGSIGLELFP